MKTTQDLFNEIMVKIQRHASLAQIEKVSCTESCTDMHLWHSGHVTAYKVIAEKLVNFYGCKASFIESERE
jgi:hypothetical protein